jgi:hypothetical protein
MVNARSVAASRAEAAGGPMCLCWRGTRIWRFGIDALAENEFLREWQTSERLIVGA